MGGHRSRGPPIRSAELDITKPYGYVTYMTVETRSRPRARSAGRPRDPQIGQAIDSAVRRLLSERSFAGMTMDAVAAEAGVGKPAIYRRYRDKAQMVASVVAEQLPVMEPPDLGDTRAEMLAMFTHGLPAEGLPYVALIGGLIAEHGRHPELIEAFRERVLLPRRAMVQSVIERGQARGDIRSDLDPVMGIDLLAGQFLARVFAGVDVGPAWRERAFEFWWKTVKSQPGSSR